MSDIHDYLRQILSAVYGDDMRNAIHNSIEACYNDGKSGSTDLTARRQIANLIAHNNSTDGNSELIDMRVSYDGITYPSAGEALRSQIDYLASVLNEIKDNKGFYSVHFDPDTRLLHFCDELGLDIYDPVYIEGGGGGGGSGGGSTSVVKLTNDNGTANISVSTGGSVVLKFTYTSTDDGVETGNGTCQVVVNGVVKATVNVKQGSNEIDVSDYISAGTNTIRVKCTDIYGSYKMLMYTVNVVDLSITSTFDDSVTYSGDIQFKYIPYGSISKTIHFVIDGKEKSSFTTSVSGKQITQIIPKLSHGVHRLEVYQDATMEEVPIESNRLVYDIICVEAGNKTPMIASVYGVDTIPQGSQVSIPYIVYDPSALTCNVTLTVYTISETGEVIYDEKQITVDRTRQYWDTRYYPMGDVHFRISYVYTDVDTGSLINLCKSHTINVTKNEINVEAVTNDLELRLTSTGRDNGDANYNVWNYGTINTKFENINWRTTGWAKDDNKDTVLRLNGDATAEIEFKPFSSDLRVYGKTIELDFAIRDVNNRNAVVIDCMSGDVGFTVTADKATLKSEQTTVSCNYTDEKRIRLAFVIESKNEYRLMSVYLNGVLSNVKQYPSDDNFQQFDPVNIKIGSPYCGVDIYNIRSYSTALTFTEVTGNHIYDISDVVEKSKLFEANDIYNEYGSISYEDMKKRISVMTIIGSLPQSKGDKKNVTIKYECLFNKAYDFEDNAEIDVQGTSSQWYVRKNYKIKSNNKHQHGDNQIPTNVFCVKADYAESTSTHNTQNANLVHTLYSEKTPAQVDDERCRTTIFGYPIVIFHQANSTATPEFIGKYNFNYDKGSEEVFGFVSGRDVECWEFKNNTSGECNFLASIGDNWAENFEARYPDKYKDISRFKTMHDWVVSTKDNVTKFKNEFETYFDLHYSLIYYVYTFVALMVDQRAKNMFLTYWGSTGKWQPWFYDNDTCFGINNEGELVFDYYHEDTDTVNNETVYNGQNSILWTNFREAYADEIQETYQDLRSDGLLTADKLLEYFITNGSDKWSASIYNEDSDYKYISMLRSDNDASNLYQVRGTGEDHLEYFVKNRLNYCDSKWYAADYADNYVALRVYTPNTWAGVEPNPSITITPYSNMYAGVRYKANGTLLQERAEKNVPVTFSPPTGTDLSYNENFSDTESAIYGASEISSLGDLAPLYCGTLNVSKATKLVELKVGDGTEGYVNEHLHSLSVGTNRLLKMIDIRNCPKLTDSLNLSGCPNIEEVYATGSGITGLSLTSGGTVKILELPSTLTSLVLHNQIYIERVTLEGYASIKSLSIENCPAINTLDVLNNCTNVERVRLSGVNWSFENTDYLYALKNRNLAGIDENGYNTDNMWIDGTCHVGTISGTEITELKSIYPYLSITYDTLTSDLIFMSHDGLTELHRQTIYNGGNGNDPVKNGLISTPTMESTAQYHYTFAGWSRTPNGDASPTALVNIVENRYVYVAYSATVRTYNVYFHNGSTLLQVVSNVPYGGDATYTGATPVKNDVADADDYAFAGFVPSGTNIVGETHCYAEYDFIGLYTIALIERDISGEYENDRISHIRSNAFRDCTGLDSLNLPNVTTAGSHVATGLIRLKSFSADNLTEIPIYGAFSESGIEELRLPKVTKVGDYSMQKMTSLTKVDLPVVASIGYNVFSNSTALTTLIIGYERSGGICTIGGTGALANTPIAKGNGYIYVPAHHVDSYKSDTNWCEYADQIRAIENYPEILGGDD